MMEKYGVRVCPKCGGNNITTVIAPPVPTDMLHPKLGEARPVNDDVWRFQDECECGHVSAQQNEPKKTES